MASDDECRHWCHQCNVAVWPQGQGPLLICPYCNRHFVQDSHSTISTQPWLSQHAHTLTRLCNNIFPPTTTHPYINPRIRPAMIQAVPMPRFYDHHSHHRIDSRIRPVMIPVHPLPRFYRPPEYRESHYHHIDHDPSDGDNNYYDDDNNYGDRRDEHNEDHRQVGEDDVIEAMTQLSFDEEEHHHGQPRASESAIRALPTVRVSARDLNGEGKCPVCQETFTLGSSVKKMPCEHIFHPDCIVPWLERHNTCPVCRFRLTAGESISSSSMGESSRSGSRRRRRRRSSWNPLSRLLPRLRRRPLH